MLDVYAALPHFWRHMAPIVAELRERGHEVRTWSRDGDFVPALHVKDRQRAGLTMVANWDDAQTFIGKSLVYVEHGAGQSYIGVEGHGYSGAPGLDHVRLFLAPGEPVAARWRRRYPQAAVEVVGCPALDAHALNVAAEQATVVFAQHWRCSICPETMPALPYYEPALPEVVAALREQQINLLGHAHPRAYGAARKLWTRLGVPYEPDPDVILRTAALLVVDNSSLAYEAAARDVPVLTLNAPWYRRHVHHGLRFWERIPGIQCDQPKTLLSSIEEALQDPEGARTLRRAAAAHVYSAVDGHAATRAVDAIERLLL